jgi:predicted GNAT family acetyltransferase
MTKKAFLQYEIEDSGYDLWHTEVPEKCCRQGFAGILDLKAISELAQTQWADCNIFDGRGAKFFYFVNELLPWNPEKSGICRFA